MTVICPLLFFFTFLLSQTFFFINLLSQTLKTMSANNYITPILSNIYKKVIVYNKNEEKIKSLSC